MDTMQASDSQVREQRGRLRRLLRLTVGMRQADLATRAGVSVRAVVEAEAGRSIDEDKLRAIAAALGVGILAYVEPSPMVFPAPPVAAAS